MNLHHIIILSYTHISLLSGIFGLLLRTNTATMTANRMIPPVNAIPKGVKRMNVAELTVKDRVELFAP